MENDDDIVHIPCTPYPKKDQTKNVPTKPSKRPSDKHCIVDDLCCVAVVCTKHGRLALIDIPNKGLYFPYISGRIENHSVNQIVRDLLHRLFAGQANFTNFQLTIDRIQIPNKCSSIENETNFILRFTYRIEASLIVKKQKKKQDEGNKDEILVDCICEVSNNSSTGGSQRTVPKIYWLSYDDICFKLKQQYDCKQWSSSGNNNLLGPEPKYVLEQWLQQSSMMGKTSQIRNNQPSFLSTWQLSNIENDTSCYYYPLMWNEITFDDYFTCSSNNQNKNKCEEQEPNAKRRISKINFSRSSISLKEKSSIEQKTLSSLTSLSNKNIHQSNNIKKNVTLKSCNHCRIMSYYKKEQIISLYNEYLLQCYPSRYMTANPYRLFVEKLFGLPLNFNLDSIAVAGGCRSPQYHNEQTKKILGQYFKSFDIHGLSFIHFENLLLGLMIFKEKFNHCFCGQSPTITNNQQQSCIECLRMKYEFIFRFYSSSNNNANRPSTINNVIGIMDLDDIFSMAVDCIGMALNNYQRPKSRTKRTASKPRRKRMSSSSSSIRSVTRLSIPQETNLKNQIWNQIRTNFSPLTFEQFYELASNNNGQKLFQLMGLVSPNNTLSLDTFFNTILRLAGEDDELKPFDFVKELSLPIWSNVNTYGPSAHIAIEHHWTCNNINVKCECCKQIKYNKIVNNTDNNFIININEILTNSRLLNDQQQTTEVKPSPKRQGFLSGLLRSKLSTRNNNNKQQSESTKTRHDEEIKMLAHDILDRINKMASFLFTMADNEEMAVNGNFINKANIEEQQQQTRITNTNVENWFYPTKTDLIESLRKISKKAAIILDREAKVLNISTPCYVFGDIHGNLKDLIQFSKILWPCSPWLNESRYLFLGDYVDRGQYGIECIVYLFCMKILAPHQFYLLRGNHEFREIQKQFSFYDECLSRFNDYSLWDTINHALDRLPISAIIDQRLFCAHGGIPITINTIEQIRSIPKYSQTQFMNTNSETWEILWNDPVSNEELEMLTKFQKQDSNTITNRNIIPNVKRGTAYLYTESDVETFCKKNHIDYILRAHEVIHEGFYFHHRGRVLTVFSSSKYADLTNKASVLFVDRHRIRIIQIMDNDDNYENEDDAEINTE